MNICIFGGTGLIGSSLALLLSQNHSVTIITRDATKHRERFSSAINLIEWQGEDSSLPACVHNADAIVNLVGENIGDGRWSAQKKQLLYTSRVHIGKQLVEAIRSLDKKPSVFIQASGIGYYPTVEDSTLATPCTEQSPAGIGTFLSYLAQHWEDSTKPLETIGIRRCVIRTATVLSKHGGALPTLCKPFLYYMGGYPRTGKQPFPFIHIQDEIHAIMHCIENSSSTGVYNLIAPTPLNTKEFSETLALLLKKPCYIPIPQWIMRLTLGEMAEELLLQGVLATPQKLLDEGFIFHYPNAQKALEEILL